VVSWLFLVSCFMVDLFRWWLFLVLELIMSRVLSSFMSLGLGLWLFCWVMSSDGLMMVV